MRRPDAISQSVLADRRRIDDGQYFAKPHAPSTPRPTARRFRRLAATSAQGVVSQSRNALAHVANFVCRHSHVPPTPGHHFSRMGVAFANRRMGPYWPSALLIIRTICSIEPRPPFFQLRADLRLPLRVTGPVLCRHGCQSRIRSACFARASGVHLGMVINPLRQMYLCLSH